MKNICIICETWGSGGVEAFLSNLLTHISQGKYCIDLVAIRIEKSIFTSPVEDTGIAFHQLTGDRRKIIKNLQLLSNMFKRGHYDIVYINTFHAASLYYLKLAHKAGISVRIAHSHNSDFQNRKMKLLKLAIHDFCKMQYAREATALWACSQEAAQFMFRSGSAHEKTSRVIPNGIDIRRFQFDEEIRKKARAKLGVEDEFLVGHIGRLCRQKNQLFLLRVFSQLLTQAPKSKLLLVGDGEDVQLLQKTILENNLEDHVIMPGVTEHPEEMLFAMDAFVFPSLFEGLGIAAIEAQAAGLPVLCSEKIPEEAVILPSTTVLPLNQGTYIWANALLNCRKNMADRRACAELIKRAGYDICDVAKQIEEAFDTQPK